MIQVNFPGSYAHLLWTTLCATHGIVTKLLISNEKFYVPVNEAGARQVRGRCRADTRQADAAASVPCTHSKTCFRIIFRIAVSGYCRGADSAPDP